MYLLIKGLVSKEIGGASVREVKNEDLVLSNEFIG